MKVISLQSGSNGNAIYVETAGVRLLFDAGISGKQAQSRLAQHGIDIHAIDALIISHEHVDHVAKAGVYHRKFGHAIHITPHTLLNATMKFDLGEISRVTHFHAGDSFSPKGHDHVRIHAIPTQHDCVDGTCFVIEADGKRLGLFTDLGHAFAELSVIIPTLDACIIESNFDPEMLERSGYPIHTQRRIAGPRGHLSNFEAAELITDHGEDLQWVMLAHLSGNNNTPGLAEMTHRDHHGVPIHVASRERVGDCIPIV
ncbi:MBL fold metallo-hydrolase [Poriferisphaera sp. WC338]|uniref:MBL fold metallo-hydrolase n=1 Tax=Poriferisphaera sp. WC338 TaxID=3425129 RepID=UPI003D817493